eukprot:scaffold46455_cov43-Phaeocystis_antarctica.AAC.1
MTENQKDIERLGVSIAVLVGSPVTLTLTLTLLITLSLALALIAVRVGSPVTRPAAAYLSVFGGGGGHCVGTGPARGPPKLRSYKASRNSYRGDKDRVPDGLAFREMKNDSAYKVRCRTDARSCFLPALVLTIK